LSIYYVCECYVALRQKISARPKGQLLRNPDECSVRVERVHEKQPLASADNSSLTRLDDQMPCYCFQPGYVVTAVHGHRWPICRIELGRERKQNPRRAHLGALPPPPLLQVSRVSEGGGREVAKNLKRQHSQADQKYNPVGTLSFLWVLIPGQTHRFHCSEIFFLLVKELSQGRKQAT
jgi:hypothetical protein